MSKGVERSRFEVTEVQGSRRRRVEDGLRPTYEWRVRDNRISPTRHNSHTVRAENAKAAVNKMKGLRGLGRRLTGL